MNSSVFRSAVRCLASVKCSRGGDLKESQCARLIQRSRESLVNPSLPVIGIHFTELQLLRSQPVEVISFPNMFDDRTGLRWPVVPLGAVEGGSKWRRGAAEFGGARLGEGLRRSGVCRGEMLWRLADRVSRWSSAAFGVLESVAFALGLQDVAAVGEAIQGRSGQPLAAQAPRSSSRTAGWWSRSGCCARRPWRSRRTRVPPRPCWRERSPVRRGSTGPACQVAAASARVDALLWPPSSSVISSVTRKKRTLRPWAQAAMPSARGQMRLARSAGTDQQDVLPLVEILAFDQLQHAAAC